MNKVKDQIKILERMLTTMEIRRFPANEQDELMTILADLLKMMNEGVYEFIQEWEKKKAE